MKKECRKCGSVRNHSEFFKDKRSKDGLYSSCKKCHQDYVSAWRKQNPAKPYKPAKPGYAVWYGLRQRCNKPKAINYSYYGGRGITYDPRWNSFDAFWEDMGPSFQAGLTLDRIDSSGNYCKENCRWATRTEQATNTRRNVFFEYGGEQLTLYEISRRTKIPCGTLYWHVVKKGRDLYSVIEKETINKTL